MTSGEQCVITFGTALMPLWSASNWDMHILDVRTFMALSGCLKHLFNHLLFMYV